MVAVGAVSDCHARLWLRTEVPGPFIMALWDRGGAVRTAVVADRRAPEADGTMALTLPDEAPTIGPLAPGTAYEFRITVLRTGALVAEGCFETAPGADMPRSYAFAFLSCHQPFRSDGTVHPAAARMLAILEPALVARAVKYVLLIGDQICADAPGPSSLLHPMRVQSL